MPRLLHSFFRPFCLALSFFLAPALHAETVQVAVADAFAAPMQKIAAAFERDTGHKATIVPDTTDNFYAQIKKNAPYDVLLAADAALPARLEREQLAVPGTRFTYAVGRLALWSAQADLVDGRPEVLKQGGFKHLALPDAKRSPEGAAALQALTKLSLQDRLVPKFLLGETLAQTYRLVAEGQAELGFVALPQIMADGQLTKGSAWLVPPGMHDPLKQDAVLLTRGKDNPAALALLRYLRGEKARAVIRALGYGF